MDVTSVRIDRYKPKTRGICAECSVVLDNELCIHKVLVIMGDKGLFVAYPNSGVVVGEKSSKRYSDILHPTNNSLTQSIQSKVLSAYETYTSKKS